ncbi:MAG TPA: hypothetical protein VM328_09620 [Fimbriimonadaceae bacterium]|nr:hypothetical protein [Fimbriimonadaceae bacterium]
MGAPHHEPHDMAHYRPFFIVIALGMILGYAFWMFVMKITGA